MNILKYLIIPCLLILAACLGTDNESLKKTRENTEFSMKVVIVPEHRIEQTCKELGVSYEANGCAMFDFEENKCTIFVMPQRFAHDDERLTIIGHETWHCVYGKWHD